jgi:hypothetical protein
MYMALFPEEGTYTIHACLLEIINIVCCLEHHKDHAPRSENLLVMEEVNLSIRLVIMHNARCHKTQNISAEHNGTDGTLN